jgi:16S rRNA (guanine1207-N2)-methyltransferase
MLQSFLTDILQFANDEHVVILNSAADPCVPVLVRQLSAGELLLAEDNVAAVQKLQTSMQQSQLTVTNLREVAFHEYTLHEAPATMDAAVMNILYQPNNAWMYYGLQLAAYALKPGGRLYVEGAKDRGILSLGKHMQEVFGNLETLKIGKGQRVICAVKHGQSAEKIVAPDLVAPFAQGNIDEGTSLLLDVLEVQTTDVALDIGCGAGFIGTYIAERATQGRVTLVDASRVSVAAAQRLVLERNLSNAQVLVSDGVQIVRKRRFDLVVTNPPFHTGGLQTTSIAERFIHEASQVLRPRGRFYLVANRFLKYEPVLRKCFATVEEVGGNTRFKVLQALGPALK